jgi:hypothetical protein
VLPALARHGHHGAERDGDAARGRREPLQLRELVGHEAVALEQVHGRVARQRQLREHDERGAGGLRLSGGVLDQGPVAGEIADDRVRLGQRDAH